MIRNFTTQQTGDRIYKLENCDVKLLFVNIKTLMEWDSKYPGIEMDYKYLKLLSSDVFGLECLANSNVLGRHTWNATESHNRLDETKLKFVQGDF